MGAKLIELEFQLVPHPPYSPDLASSDYRRDQQTRETSYEVYKLDRRRLRMMKRENIFFY